MLTSWVSQAAAEPPAAASCVQKMMGYGDLDGDGRLGREEFVEYTVLSIDGLIASKERELLRRPTWRDALLDPEVKRLRLERIQGRARGEQIFVRADRNGDDHLDGPELMAICEEWLRNKDL